MSNINTIRKIYEAFLCQNKKLRADEICNNFFRVYESDGIVKFVETDKTDNYSGPIIKTEDKVLGHLVPDLDD